MSFRLFMTFRQYDCDHPSRYSCLWNVFNLDDISYKPLVAASPSHISTISYLRQIMAQRQPRRLFKICCWIKPSLKYRLTSACEVGQNRRDGVYRPHHNTLLSTCDEPLTHAVYCTWRQMLRVYCRCRRRMSCCDCLVLMQSSVMYNRTFYAYLTYPIVHKENKRKLSV